MTGARIEMKLDDRAALAGLARLRELKVESNSGMLRAIGVGLVKNTQARFDQAVDPEGKAWTPLKPAYAAMKQGPGILREAGMRGGLQGSITFRVSGGNIEVGTNKKYGAVHQFGATIVPKNAKALVFRMMTPQGTFGLVRVRSVTIPARPYLGFSAADRVTVLEAIDVAIERAIKTD